MRFPSSNTRRRRSRASSASGGPVAPEASYVARRNRRVHPSMRSRGAVFPRRRPSVPTRRAALAILIVLSMALITVSYRGGGVLHGAQLVVLEAVSPIERGLSRAWDPIAGAWNWTGRVFTAANENPRLERENEQLREQLLIARQMEDDYDDVRRALNFDDRFRFPAGYDRTWAQVTVRQPGAVESSLVIDRGSSDGVRRDDPVMVTGGLIGKVLEVTDDQAVVGLLLDDAQRVSASVVSLVPGEQSDAWGVLRTVSTEGQPTMQLRFVKQGARVKEGDLVVTSGFASENGELRSIYPKGVPIGMVTSVGNDPADLHKTVQVTPIADFDEIEEVMVLLPTDRGDAG